METSIDTDSDHVSLSGDIIVRHVLQCNAAMCYRYILQHIISMVELC